MAKSQKQRPSPEDSGGGGYDPELVGLIERSGFIFIGRAGQGQGVLIEEVLLSTEALRGLAGKRANLFRGGQDPRDERAHRQTVFFSNIISLGGDILLRLEGEAEAGESSVANIREHIRYVRSLPLRRRVEEADLIITGLVLDSRPAHEPRTPRSEHDPDWWLSKVKVQRILKGASKQQEIEVLFPNSMDIVWARSPKLHEGDNGIFLLKEVAPKEVVPELNRAVYQVTDPLDFLPIDRLEEIETILDHENGEH